MAVRMTTYNTGNTVPSVDVRDLYDNAENLDNFSNGAADEYADRLGVVRQSLQGIRNASQYTNLGAYGAGLVFTSYNQTFSYLGEFYAPSAGVALPYTTTGVGAAELATFRSVGDATLRADLANPSIGVSLVAGAIASVASIAGLSTAAQTAGRALLVAGYHAGLVGGGGNFLWDATKARSLHNGGTVIDPTRAFPADWTNQTQVTTWFTPSTGAGCWVRQLDGALNVRWFGAKGDSVADDTKALQKVIDQAIPLLQAVYVSPGTYRTTAQLTIPQNVAVGNAYGVSIYGDNASWQGVSVIYAQHTGAAILSLKGTNGCLIEGIKFISHATTYPKCALVLGRDVNVDSCGWHTINRIWIDGLYSKAAIYSIASEENKWSDIFVQLRGGGALYGFYTGISDALTVDSLPTSSNIANSVTKMNIWNWVNNVNAACIYIEGAQAVGSWSFTDCYCIPKSGSYYQINIGAIDALPCLGPFTFIGCGGEIYDAVNPYLDSPLNGFKISSPGGTLNVAGLTILGSRCQLINASGTRKILNVASNLTLVKPNIVIQPLEDPTTTYTAIRNKIKAGIFDVANSSSWIPLTFSGSWVNQFGAPYAPGSFQVDSTGTLSMRGYVGNGTTGVGTIAQLPAGYEPAYNMFFTVSDGSALAKILITTAGLVTLNVGTGAAVDLSNVRFKLVDA
jgi:hypothetical protein